jgi:hypothetical protein
LKAAPIAGRASLKAQAKSVNAKVAMQEAEEANEVEKAEEKVSGMLSERESELGQSPSAMFIAGSQGSLRNLVQGERLHAEMPHLRRVLCMFNMNRAENGT